MITSIKNPKIRIVRDLISAKKHRNAAQAMVLEGVRLVEEALKANAEIRQCMFSKNLSERGKSLLIEIEQRANQIEEVSPDLMDRISDTQTSQGILLICSTPAIPFPQTPDFILALDLIGDPGNLGTILRTAAALEIDGIFLTPGTTDPFAPKVLRAAMGAQLHLPICWKAAGEIKEFCSKTGHQLLLTISLMNCSRSCWEADLTQPICLVIGSEANGVSSELQLLSDACLRIPIGNKTESFNAAIAAGILMYEVKRQRNKK